MIQKLLLPAFIFSVFSLKAQDKHYRLISEQTYNCMTEIHQRGTVANVDFKNCLRSAILANSQLMYDEVLSKVVKKGDPDSVSYRKGEEYGKVLASRLDTALVYSCDTYYRIADSLRYDVFRAFNIDLIVRVADTLNKVTIDKSRRFYDKRAKMNYLAGNFKQALSDVNIALSFAPADASCLIVKGYAFEGLKRYKGAAEMYYKLAALSGERAYLVWAAIANRKASGH